MRDICGRLPTQDVLIIALVVRWTVQAVEMAAVLSGESQWCVIEADCLQVLPWLPDKSVAHVITDPPYESEAHTKARRSLVGGGSQRRVSGGQVRTIDEPLKIRFPPITQEQRSTCGVACGRVVQRWVIAFCQAEAVAWWRTAMVAGGLDWVRAGVWIKPNGAPQFTGDRPGQGFESLAIGHAPGRKHWNGGGRHAVWVVPLGKAVKAGGGSEKNEHPTTKPLPLMIDLLEDFTDPGEVILDAFAGSGTTGVAALRLGRRAILIERDPKYAAIARQRMEAEQRGQSLKEYRAGQRTLWEG